MIFYHFYDSEKSLFNIIEFTANLCEELYKNKLVVKGSYTTMKSTSLSVRS